MVIVHLQKLSGTEKVGKWDKVWGFLTETQSHSAMGIIF